MSIRYEDGEARRIFAACDFMLMPSRFEPCGAHPDVRTAVRVASHRAPYRRLADTIEDGKTGFLFREPSLGGFLGAVCRAFSTFGSKRQLNTMRRKAMERVFSWDDSARTYSDVYQRVLQ